MFENRRADIFNITETAPLGLINILNINKYLHQDFV